MGFAKRDGSNSRFCLGKFSSKAQGTVEYLVIIAVVIVLSLVVVGLVLSQTESASNVSKTSSKIGDLSQSIGITEALVSPTDGNFIVKLLNNSGGTLTISNVKIGDSNVSFSEDLVQSGSKLFKVATRDVCELGKVVSANVVITYVTAEGLTKIFRYPAKVMFDCSPFNVAQVNLANQCPPSGGSCILTGNATEDTVLSGYSFYSNDSGNKLTGNYDAPSVSAKYANLGSGQTTCHDADGNPRTCAGTGEDGEIYGASYAHVWRDNSDGTVSDLNSGLMWQVADLGVTDTWQNSLDYCNNNTPILPGSGWRLPTVNEINAIYDYSTGTCNSVFSGGCNYYWSSTSLPSYPYLAYHLHTGLGTFSYATKATANPSSARCVRFES